jgi:hypothetical protein
MMVAQNRHRLFDGHDERISQKIFIGGGLSVATVQELFWSGIADAAKYRATPMLLWITSPASEVKR